MFAQFMHEFPQIILTNYLLKIPEILTTSFKLFRFKKSYNHRRYTSSKLKNINPHYLFFYCGTKVFNAQMKINLSFYYALFITLIKKELLVGNY